MVLLDGLGSIALEEVPEPCPIPLPAGGDRALKDLLSKQLAELRWQLRIDIREELETALRRGPADSGCDGGTGSFPQDGDASHNAKDIRNLGHNLKKVRVPPVREAHPPHPGQVDDFVASAASTESKDSFSHSKGLKPANWHGRNSDYSNRSEDATPKGNYRCWSDPDCSAKLTPPPHPPHGKVLNRQTSRSNVVATVDPKVAERLAQKERRRQSRILGPRTGRDSKGDFRKSFVQEIGRGSNGSALSTATPIDEDKQEGPRSETALTRFVKGPDFDYLSGFALIVNAIVIGVETDIKARSLQVEAHTVFGILDVVFCIFFTTELALRVRAYGSDVFRIDWKWNLFDSLVVGTQIFELSLQFIGALVDGKKDREESHFGFMRVLKLLRLVRVIRLMRVIRLVGELRALVTSIAGSLKSLVWAILLLMVMMFVAGVYLTQLVYDHRMASPADENDPKTDLIEYWGSLGDAIYTLWQTVTGGVDWGDVVNPLREHIHPILVPLFMLYTAFAILCMLNVITGVFVESALQSAKIDKDVYMIDHVRTLFSEFDENSDGCLSWEEFQSISSNGGLESLLMDLGMEQSEAESLFKLLDVNDSGAIDLNEFIHGCSRLRGPVRFLDFGLMQKHNNRLCEMQRVNAEDVARHLRRMDRMLSSLGEAATEEKSMMSMVLMRQTNSDRPLWGTVEEA